MKNTDNTTTEINVFRFGIITSGISIALTLAVAVLILSGCQSAQKSQNKTENETKMQKLNRILKKTSETIDSTNQKMNTSMQNTGGQAGKEECFSWDDKCLERNNLKTYGKSRPF